MKRARLAIAGLVALFAAAVMSPSVAASNTINLGPQAPSAPVHVVVGDQLVVTLPPASLTPSPNETITGDPRYPLPTSSDSSVLPRVSAGYQPDGTAVAVFRAASSGTATITTHTPQLEYCFQSTPTPSPSSTPATTTTTTSSSATPSASPTHSVGGCASSVALYQVTVVVSATGVQSITVPATGAGVYQFPAALVAAAGAVLAALVIGGVALTRRLRKLG
jgi:hypothetical protein